MFFEKLTINSWKLVLKLRASALIILFRPVGNDYFIIHNYFTALTMPPGSDLTNPSISIIISSFATCA